MTDRPASHITSAAPSPNPPVNGVFNHRSGQAFDSAGSPIEEEEDYIIKCFCGFQWDDGNTVFCERCDTWQHIECYYYEHYRNGMTFDIKKIDHACVDCLPRAYDKKSAIERQKNRFWPGERKVKKVPPKPVKRRAKPSESHPTLTNGFSHEGYDQPSGQDRTSDSPKDQGPPTKRPKTSHRASGSLNIHAGPFASRSHSSRKVPKNTAHLPSVNDYFAEPPSLEFLCLYDDDPGETLLPGNVFNDIVITRSLSEWSHDVESLSDATNGCTPAQIFHRLDEPLDGIVMPLIRTEHRVERSIEIQGRHPQWMFLATENPMAKESIVGELRGKIGHMQDYCQDNANRWDYLRHPAPFVFFHPKLPIYIDTRQDGSKCRYLRRSCRPNVELRTILENGSDYRFIFITKEPLEAGAELTIPWTLDEHIRRRVDQLSNPIKQEAAVDAEAAYVSGWVQKVLSNFGGCACESLEECGLVKWLRPRDPSLNGNGMMTNGKSLKGRNGHTKATWTPEFGNGITSRASSEGMKRTDDEDLNNSRSTSGSKSPTRHPSGVPSLEISGREKRKIAAAEKTFEQIEQERQLPAHKRKKRSSAGSNLNTPTATSSVGIPSTAFLGNRADFFGQKQLGHGVSSVSQPNTPSLFARPRYADVSTSHKDLGSPGTKAHHTSSKRQNVNTKRSSHPNTPSTSSPLIRQNYVHKSVQTDAEPGVWDQPAAAPGRKRKVYISLGKRLLMRCQQDRDQAKQRRISMENNTDTFTADTLKAEAAEQTLEKATGNINGENADVEMELEPAKSPDLAAPENMPPERPVEKPRPPDKDMDDPGGSVTSIKPPPPPSTITSLSVSPNKARPINGFRSPDLRVQLPAVQPISHDAVSASPIGTITTPTIARSPFPHTSNSYPPLFSNTTPNAVAPSPVKKVSLGEYFSRRKTESQISTNEKATGSMTKGLVQGPEINKPPALDGESVANPNNKEESDALLGGRKSSAP